MFQQKFISFSKLFPYSIFSKQCTRIPNSRHRLRPAASTSASPPKQQQASLQQQQRPRRRQLIHFCCSLAASERTNFVAVLFYTVVVVVVEEIYTRLYIFHGDMIALWSCDVCFCRVIFCSKFLRVLSRWRKSH